MAIRAHSNEGLPAEHEIEPHYQPIISLQTGTITGYEVLGRQRVGREVRSLGPFFKDPSLSDDVHLSIDRLIRAKAFRKLAGSRFGGRLFINLKPSWIYRKYRETRELPTLQLLEKYKISGTQLVIEVTEEEFDGHLDELFGIIQLYRLHGCLIAIDDIGSGFSSLDRIAVLRPDIMKIDLTLLKKSRQSSGYQALMQSFSTLSAQMGASLLVEGVETRDELQHAIHAGARYVQGYLFSPAVPDFMAEHRFAGYVEAELRAFRDKELAQHKRLSEVERGLEQLTNVEVAISGAEDADRVLERFIPSLTRQAIRMYICREDGSQVSSNFSRDAAEGWVRDASFRGANWVWRPYFLPNIVTMRNRQLGLLSQPYTDLDSLRLIQTYSCPLCDGYYLFIDLERTE